MLAVGGGTRGGLVVVLLRSGGRDASGLASGGGRLAGTSRGRLVGCVNRALHRHHCVSDWLPAVIQPTRMFLKRF